MIETSLLGGEMAIAPDAVFEPATKWSGSFQPIAASTGRCALRLIAGALRARGCASVLLPAFICQSVVDPFVEADFTIVFFPIDSSLQIDAGKLADLLRGAPDAALLFVDYFGFPPEPAPLRVLRQAAQRRVVIEDCSHGSWMESARPPVGTVGNVVFSSLRKYLPLPDGCALLDRNGLVRQRLDRALPPYTAARFVAAQLKHIYLCGSTMDPAIERVYLKLLADAERSIESAGRSFRVSPTAKRLLRGMDFRQCVGQRRANFRTLLQCFSTDRRLRLVGEPVIRLLRAGVSPFAFPIRVKGAGRRDRLRALLAAQRLFCAVHWPAPYDVKATRFPEACALSSEILSLPTDQRYTPAHMCEIVRRLGATIAEL